MTDLEEAIKVLKKAINMTPETHPDWAERVHNLSITIDDKYAWSLEISDLEQAILYHRIAVGATSEEHPGRTAYMYDLAMSLRHRYLRKKTLPDFEEAIQCLQSALHQVSAPAITRIQAGQEILQSHMVNSDWERAYQAANEAVRLIPKLIRRSLGNSDKRHILGQTMGFASDSVEAAFFANKEPIVALELLEQGRSVLATSLEDIRTEVQALKEKHTDLAQRFTGLRDELDYQLNKQDPADRRFDAEDELDELVAQIRKQSGFEDFLLPPNKKKVQDAAECGAIVVINMGVYRCDAVLIETHQIRSLKLSKLQTKDIIDFSNQGDLWSSKVLEWLWDTIAEPVLDALGVVGPPSTNWPHIWWVPTRFLSGFPFHAVGYHLNGSSETVLDRVVSSYSPSIRTIVYSRARPEPEPNLETKQALLIAMEHTPGFCRLPFAKDEINMLKGICESMGVHTVEPMRRKEVIRHLKHCEIFHFAGHGYTDRDDPLKSRLLLDNGETDSLTVAVLLDMNLRKTSPFLAYLSACGTGGLLDRASLDESIHLISACQLAGFRRVVETLWEVNDELCVDVARIMYSQIQADGGLTDKSIRQGLHTAIRELRDRWLEKLTAAESKGTVKRTGTPLTGEEVKRWDANNEGSVSKRPLRDATLLFDDDYDSSSEQWANTPYWVPYVHYGV
jgi:tetratricopeptide (TPR) repeat protein